MLAAKDADIAHLIPTSRRASALLLLADSCDTRLLELADYCAELQRYECDIERLSARAFHAALAEHFAEHLPRVEPDALTLHVFPLSTKLDRLETSLIKQAAYDSNDEQPRFDLAEHCRPFVLRWVTNTTGVLRRLLLLVLYMYVVHHSFCNA